jgi:thiamine kinase-like enzyme
VLGLHHSWAHRLRKRAESGALTLAHGDCYLSNWLIPRAGVTGQAVAIDFQQAHRDDPGEDLAFLLGTFWTPAQRSRHEARCLRRYLARLDRPGYGVVKLLDDYRWGLERMVVRTVWDHANGSPEWYWRPKLERVTAALADHLR